MDLRTSDPATRDRTVPGAVARLRGSGLVPAAVIVGATLLALAMLARKLIYGTSWIPGFQEPLYWLSYADGFVRRGLPGEVLSLLSGGTPSAGLVDAAAALLLAATIVALVGLGWQAGAASRTRAQRLTVLAVVVVSPLTITLALRDVGRFDGIGVVALLVLVLAPWRRNPRVAAVLSSVAVVLAVGSEEFLIGFLAPVVGLQLWQLARDRRPVVGLAAVALAPGAVLAAASLLVRPGPAVVDGALDRAVDAGVAPADYNGVAVLDSPLSEQIGHVADFTLSSVLLATALWAGLHLAAAALLSRALPPFPVRLLAALTGYFAVAALVMSVVGVDYRRWWALALVGLVASCAVLARGSRPAPDAPGRALPVLALGVYAAACVAAADVPLYPSWGAL